MGRLFPLIKTGSLLLLLLALAGCGKTKSQQIVSSVTVSFGSTSLEVGSVTSVSVTAKTAAGATVSGLTFTFNISPSGGVDIANITSGTTTGYFACAGKWDTTLQVCSPGPTGQVIVSALAGGAQSAPLVLNVHQHVDSVQVAAVPGTPNYSTDPNACVSLGVTPDYRVYQATARSNGADITSTVGPISWSSIGATGVVSVSSAAAGLLPSQAQATARAPGEVQIFASVGGATSAPVTFKTCAVQSITLSITGQSSNALTLEKGKSVAITATVVDTQGVTLTTPPLTWITSTPASVSVSTSGSLTAAQPAGSVVTAACVPPTCNAGITPTPPLIYSPVPVTATVTGAKNQTSAYVTTTGCIDPATHLDISGCSTFLFAFALSTNLFAAPVAVPRPPNSFLINPQGTKGFLGSSHGLLVFDTAASTFTTVATATGTALAVSPDGTKVVVLEASTTPNQVFVVSTGTNTVSQIIVPGTTGDFKTKAYAAFSPDSLKAYIAVDPEGSGNGLLLIDSALAGTKSIALNAAPIGVVFLPNGAYAYVPSIAGSVHKISTFSACNDVAVPGADISWNGTPQLITPSNDGRTFWVVQSPNLTSFSVTTGPANLSANPSGCPLTLTNNPQSGVIGFGQGNFTPLQLFVSSDGSTVYILTTGAVLGYNNNGGIISAVGLVGGAGPVRGDLTTDATALYVGGDDDTLHRINLATNSDDVQVPVSFTTTTQPVTTTTLCALQTGAAITCHPDLVAVKP
jgi:trimeric autotransporter adhesin